MSPQWKRVLRYGVAVALSAAALALALALDPVTRLSPFVLFYAAVAAASWYGGAGPGLLAIALGGTAVTYFVLEPVGSLSVATPGHASRLALFVLLGALVALLNGQLHTANAQWAAEARAARIGEARAKRLAESNLIAVFFCDLGGRVRWGNDAFVELVGTTPDELARRELNWRDLTALEHRDRDDRAVAELRARRVCHPFEKDNVRRPDGRRVPVLMGCAMLDGPGEDDCVGFLVDLTERRAAEEAVRDHQRRLHALASELLRAEERERRRVAVVLHDSVSATLALAKRSVCALGRTELEHAARAARAAEIEQMLGQAIEHTRSLTSELSPPVLYELGLVPALRWLCDRFAAEHGLACDVEDDGRPKPVGDELRLVLFQAARELLVNAVKHARAARCRITVRRVAADAGRTGGARGGSAGGGDWIEMAVVDDGLGFAAAAGVAAAALAEDGEPVARSDGFGLFNIRERLAHLGGRLDIASEPDAGATVTVTAPLAAAAAAPAHTIYTTPVVDGATV